MSEMIKVPEGWESTELGSSIEFIRNGYSGQQKNYLTNFPVTRIETISNGYIDFDKVGYVSNINTDYALINGDILLSNINSVKHIGKIAQYDSSKTLYHGMNLLLLRFKEDKNSSFMYYYLLTKKSWFENNCSVAINQASINQSRIKELELIIPKNEKEQQKIAEVLSEVDNAISKTEELFEKNKRLKTSLMQDLLSYGVDENGKIRNPQTHTFKSSKLGDIPDEWDVKNIGDIYKELRTGSTPSRANQEYFRGEILWVTSGELKYKIITNTIEKITDKAVKDTNLKIYPAGTFFIAITGLEAEGTRGSCAVTGKEATTNQSCMAFEANEEIDTSYLFQYYLLHGKYISLYYSQGSKQQSLNNKIVAQIPIHVPPLPEQQKIAQILSAQDEKIEDIKNKLNKLKSLKASLMQDLLSGKVKVTKLMEENS